MSDKGWMRRALAAGFLRWVGFSAAPLVLAVGVSAMTFIAGALRGEPWMWILMASSVAFAATAVGILRVSEMRERWRADNKLLFIGPYVAIAKTPDRQNISGVQLGIVLQSTASFSLSYKVKMVRTSADDTIPNRGTMNNMGTTLQPGLVGLFKDRPIDLKAPKIDMNATLEFELVYGHEGREKYGIHRAIDLSCVTILTLALSNIHG